MTQTLTALRSIQVKDQLELVRITIDVLCDGTTNTVTNIQRLHQAVSRSNTNVELRRDISFVSKDYKPSDFSAGVQTGIQNFIDAIDIKP